MRTLNALLLGSATLLTVVSVAAAADLPSRKAAPAEYVKICDAYGQGFFAIPGTDSCIHVGGLVRAEYGYGQPGNLLTLPTFKGTVGGVAATPANTTLVPSNLLDVTGFQGRARVDFEGRSPSPYGDVRTMISIRGQATSGIYTSADNYATGAFTGQAPTAPALTLEQAIVQFAGFTFGRTTRDVFSFMPGIALGSFSHSSYAGATNLLSYTLPFGGGFSATVGIEDRAGQNDSVNPGYTPIGPGGAIAPAGSFNDGGKAGLTANAITNGPLTLPAFGGNLRYDGGWGSAQVMGVVQQNSVATNLTPGTTGSPNFVMSQTGYALGAGLKLNLPMIAAGDQLHVTAAYANGDIVQLQSFNSSAVTSGFGREVPGLQRWDRDLYLFPSAAMPGCTATTLTSACFQTEQTSGWSTAAFFLHYWTPTVRQWFLGSYMSLNPGLQTRTTDWTLGGLTSMSLIRVGTQLLWSPVKDLDIAGEVDYVKMNQGFAATSVSKGGTGMPVCFGGPLTGTAACKALGVSAAGSSDVEARMRVERRF